MAHIEESGGQGRRSNVDLNLVPFIDLMSVVHYIFANHGGMDTSVYDSAWVLHLL